MLHIKSGFDWPAVSEKLFKLYGDKNEYCPCVEADEPLGQLFSKSLIFTAHFLHEFPFK